MAVEKKISLTCTRCGLTKKAKEFYRNSGEKATGGYDLWCKECVHDFVVDLETLVKYCSLNHRYFSDALYKWCEEAVDDELLRDDKYKKIKNTQEKKEYRLKILLSLYYKMMNTKAYYRHTESVESVEDIVYEYMEERISDKKIEMLKNIVDDEVDAGFASEEKFWDDNWLGHFTEWELNYLNNYYARLSKEFSISDIHMEDNFKEVAKASLEKILAYNALKKNEPGAEKRWKSATDMFISLSDQARLSSSKRVKEEIIGDDSLGEIIRYIEYTGILTKKQTFEEDDVDYIIKDFKHTFKSFSPSDIALPIEDGEE